MIEIQLKGARETERKLRALETRVATQIVRKAVKKSLLPVKRDSKKSATSIVGGDMGQLLRKNIIVRAFRRQRPHSYGARVMLKPKVPEFAHITKQGKRQYIPAAIEYGHVSWRGAKAFVPAMPFMRIAAQQSLPKAKAEFSQRLKAGIEAVARGG
jgi:hypothetical protein